MFLERSLPRNESSTGANVHDSVRQLLSLPYLPDTHIARAFRYLWRHNEDPAVDQLCQYIQQTWIASEQWPPSAWSVFRSTIRTNNDVEGWHRALNNRAGRGQLQLYVLLPLLQREASLLPLQAKLVHEKKLQRRVYVYFSSLSYH